jgi:hypothetical protein
MGDEEATTAKCSKGCANCWRVYIAGLMRILQLQNWIQHLLETV